MTDVLKEIRCKEGPRALLMKMKVTGDQVHVTSSNLLQLQCSWCTRQQRRLNPDIVRVCHEFNILGELVNSEIEYR